MLSSGRMPGMKDGEAHVEDLAAVADLAVADAARGAAAAGYGAHQFTPRGVRAGMVGRVDGHVAGAERIHGVNLQAVGILLDDVVGLHPADGSRPARQACIGPGPAAGAAGALPGCGQPSVSSTSHTTGT